MPLKEQTPPGYDKSCHHFVFVPSDATEAALLWKANEAFTFVVPKIPKWSIVVKQPYTAAHVEDGEILPGGKFVHGNWECDINSNGVEESLNPTPLSNVVDEMEASLSIGVSRIRAWFAP